MLVLDDGVRLLRWTAGAPTGISNPQLRLAIQDRLGSCSLELDTGGLLITQEEYFPYGGTAVLAGATQSDVDNKTIRYSGKERDATGLYYYGFRYYQPWIGRWLNTDPAGTVDGLNLYRMAGGNPSTYRDIDGRRTPTAPGGRRKVIPAHIHYVWIGTREFTKFNIDLAASKHRGTHTVHIHVDAGPDLTKGMVEKMKTRFAKLQNVQVEAIRDSKWYRDMESRHPRTANIYNEIVQSDRFERYAVAADIARYYVVEENGGIYSDVDDRFSIPIYQNSFRHLEEGQRSKQDQLTSAQLKRILSTDDAVGESIATRHRTVLLANPGQVLTNKPNRRQKNPEDSFLNNSHFAAHKGAHALTHLLDSINREIDQNSVEKLDAMQGIEERFRFISLATGPGIFTRNLLECDYRLGQLFNDLEKEGGEEVAETMAWQIHQRMPLFGVLLQGSDMSWRRPVD